MAFEITSEQEMIRLMARDFARKELEPMAAEWERQGIFPMDAVKKMGGLGLLGMMVPPELGGSGAGTVAYSLALQESPMRARRAQSPCRSPISPRSRFSGSAARSRKKNG